jgi:hypothetical protein
MLPGDFLACSLRFLLLHAIDMQSALEGSLVFRFTRLDILEYDRSTHNRAGSLRPQDGTEIQHAVGGMRIIQRPLMIPADEDIGVLLIHGIQNPCIGAIALIADHHIPWLETIPLQALPSLRRSDLHFMQAQRDQVDHQVETIIAAGCAGALHCGPITRQEAEVLGHRRQGVQGEHPLEQRFEKRSTSL